MTFIKTWDETNPADTKSASLGAGDIRDLTYAIRERLAIDHYFLATEAGDVKIGYHKSGTFIDQTNDLLGVTGAVRLYGKTISGKIELFLVMADNTVVQITSSGKLNAAAIQGVIPIANLATGTPDGTKFVRDDGTLQTPSTAGAGEVIQVVNVQSGGAVTCSTPIPFDTSIPKITEGDLVMTLAITPKYATSKLLVTVTANICHNSTGVGSTAALFKDSDTDALAAGSHMEGYNNNTPTTVTFSYYLDASTVAEKTFTVRVGAGTGTAYFNSDVSGVVFAAAVKSSITIQEIKV